MKTEEYCLLKRTSTTGADPSFLKFDTTWHLGLESIILRHEILKRKALNKRNSELNY